MVRKHYIETETKLQNMSKKYRDIIPETLCNNNDRGSVGGERKTEYIKILLFCYEGYSYTYYLHSKLDCANPTLVKLFGEKDSNKLMSLS